VHISSPPSSATKKYSKFCKLHHVQGETELIQPPSNWCRLSYSNPGATMRALAFAMLFAAAAWLPQDLPASPHSQVAGQPQPTSASHKPIITIPEGTKIALELTAPIYSKTAKPGDGVYAATAFPVSIHNQMAIPPGTYVEGRLDAVTSPAWKTGRAQLQMHFTKMIFANNFVTEFGSAPEHTARNIPGVFPAAAAVYVVVLPRGDVLLDNGSQIEMILQTPLSIDAAQSAAAARAPKPQSFAPIKSGSRCVPISATPGTSPMVIPGTSGSLGTPPTVIPGAPGQPEIVIPGTPPSPGTPDTVIAGSSGNPSIPCPGPPVVTTVPDDHDVHTKSLEVSSPQRVTGALLAPGKYQLRWTGRGPNATVEILQKGKAVARVQARVLLLDRKPADDDVKTHVSPDGSISLEAVVFARENFALVFR
jgi:hypothetical protein